MLNRTIAKYLFYAVAVILFTLRPVPRGGRRARHI